MNQKLNQFMDRLIHSSRLRSVCRRGVAFALSAAMMAPVVPSFAAGTGLSVGGLLPVKMAQAGDFPKIEIEGNFVQSDGLLTGFYELGLRVQPPKDKTFQRLTVMLEVDLKHLTPVDWTANAGEIKVTGVDYYKKQLDVWELGDLSEATAFSGNPNDGIATDTGFTQGVEKGDKALVKFVVTSREAMALSSEKPTTLAALRFRVDPEWMKNVSITKNGLDYEVRYKQTDGTRVPITSVKDLVGASGVKLMAFADDGDIALSTTASEMALDYVASTTYGSTASSRYVEEYYHVPGVNLDDPDPATGKYLVDQLEEIKSEGKTYWFDKKPDTQNGLIRAVDLTAATEPEQDDTSPNFGKPNDKYSYTSNLMGDSYITFPIVSKLSFADSGVNASNFTTVVYVDWDNTIIGTQVVPKNKDVRALVSDFVAENFIYHDSDPKTYDPNTDINDPALIEKETALTATPRKKADVVSSLERIDNYRGKYPATGPAPLDKDGNVIDDVTIVDGKDDPNTPEVEVEPGKTYPLSNKLDYVFFKRPMQHTVAYKDALDKDGNPLPAKPDPLDLTTYPDGAKDTQYKADLAAYEQAYHDWYYAKTEWSQKLADPADPLIPAQPGDTAATDPYWDVEYPYAYGWARCTVDNYEDVWTTLGMGELGSTAAATQTGSFAEAAGTSKGYSGAVAGGYQDLSTAPNNIASVTYDGDAAFAFADLEKGFTNDENTVVLKAVYEPGKDLYDTNTKYRMVESPYYNKLNGNAANNGGAYSADITFERSDAVRSGDVHGVARMRDVIIRQDSTTDLYWENEDLDGELENASQQQADSGKKKTAYVPVTVDNGDIIGFTLTLSARFNKIDYYLIERYGSNFVAGDKRSFGNADKYPQKDDKGKYDYSKYVLDNYNYYAEDSERKVIDSIMDDEYYDVLNFDEREGSHGFVLEGTLNNLMGYASRYVDDPVNNSANFYVYVKYDSIADANIRTKEHNKVQVTDQSTMQNAFIALAQEVVDNHRGDPDYWNNDKDWAELTYHQIQHYITSGVLYSRADADAIPIQWCNLHVDCANQRSGKPTDWAGVITAARKAAQDNDPNKPIGTLDAFTSVDELEALVHIRQAGGVKYPDKTSLAQAIVDAVKALDNGSTTVTTIYSWDQIQTQILGDPTANDYEHARNNYFWFDGTDSVSFDSLADTVAAAMDAITPTKTAPGETTAVKRQAKLNQLRDVWQANFSATGATVTTAWRNATKNLSVATDTGSEIVPSKFTTFEAFTSAFIAAVTAANTAGHSAPILPEGATPEQTQQYETALKAYWQKLQYHICHTSYPTAGDQTEMDGYWWYDGAVKISDLDSLLKAARDYLNGTNTASWNNFTNVDDLYADANKGSDSAPGLGFREKFDATKYDAASFADFKAAVLDFAQTRGLKNENTATSTDWDMLQYYITNNKTYETNADERNRQTRYYWWKNGGSAAAVDFTTWQSKAATDRADDLAKAILDAAFRANYNGNTVAWDEMDAAALESGRLVKAWATTENTFPGDFTLLAAGDLDDLKALAKTLMEAKAGNASDPKPTFPAPTVSWETIQYALLNSNAYDPAPADAKDYWWKSADTKPSDKDDEDVEFAKLVGYIAAVAEAIKAGEDPSAAETALRDFFTEEMAQYLGLLGADMLTPVTQAELDTIVWTGDPLNDGALIFGFNDDAGDGALCWGDPDDLNGDGVTEPSHDFTFTWYQMQDILINMGMYLENATASRDTVIGNSCPIPDWVAKWDDGAGEYVDTGKETVVVPLVVSYALAPNLMMAANRAPLSKEQQVQALIDQLEELTGQKVVLVDQPDPKPAAPDTDVKTPDGSDETKKDDTTYTITSDTDVKAPEKDDTTYTITSDTNVKAPEKNTADDNNSQPPEKITTVPKDTEATVPVQKKAETATSVPIENKDIDDNNSQSAADPPTVRLLESVTDLRAIREGPTRFRASPQRSPWIRFPVIELLPTLINRRITA